MEIDTQETFLIYCCSPQPRTILQNSCLSSPPPSTEKVSFQFTRQTFKFVFDKPQDFLYRIREEAEFPSMDPLCICFNAKEVDRGNDEFYLSVYESLKRIGIRNEGLHGLSTSIVENAVEVKRLERSSNPSFEELVLKVRIIEADVVTASNLFAETENAIRASMEEIESENYGMVATSKKGKKRMMKSIIVVEEENSPVKDRGDGRWRKRSRESIQDETCAICKEDIPAGSPAAQVPCLHVFHSICIEKWLGVSHFCPLCRFEFPTN